LSHSYRDLIVWQKAKAMAVDVYRATDAFPKCELYGLTSQLRRAAVSISSNIAEGQGRLTRGEFSHFLGQARGSLFELESQLAISLDLQLLSTSKFQELDSKLADVRKLLNGLLIL
jgi:four helix bundle protein